MDVLKKLFPLSFKFAKDVANLIIGILVYLVVDIILGVAIGLLAKLPIVGVIIGVAGGLVGLYTLVGIVVLILVFAKVLKD